MPQGLPLSSKSRSGTPERWQVSIRWARAAASWETSRSPGFLGFGQPGAMDEHTLQVLAQPQANPEGEGLCAGPTGGLDRPRAPTFTETWIPYALRPGDDCFVARPAQHITPAAPRP